MYKKTAKRLGWALFALGLVANAVEIALAVFAELTLPELTYSSWYSVILIAVGMYLCGFPTFMLMTKNLPTGDDCRGHARLSTREVLKLYVMCMFWAYLFSVVGMVISEVLSALTGGMASNPVADMSEMSGVLPMVIGAGICSPIIEEIIFRKVLLGRALPYGQRAAVWFTAICFGLLHMNLYQFFYAVALGVIFGHIAVKTGGIKYTVKLHIMVNMTSAALLPLFSMIGEDGDALAGVFVLAMIIGGLALWIKNGKAITAVKVGPITEGERAERRPDEGAFVNDAFDPDYERSRGHDDFLSDTSEIGAPLRARDLYLNSGFAAYFILCLVGIVYMLF